MSNDNVNLFKMKLQLYINESNRFGQYTTLSFFFFFEWYRLKLFDSKITKRKQCLPLIKFERLHYLLKHLAVREVLWFINESSSGNLTAG